MSSKDPLKKEDASFEQVAYMARLVEHTSEAVYSVSKDFIIRSWNGGAEKLYGFTAAEAIGQPTFSIVRSEMNEQDRLKIRKDIVDKGYWEGELEHQTKNGSTIFVLASATMTRNDKGEIEGYVSVAKDITARKKLEVELKKAHGEIEAFSYSVSHDLRAPLRSIAGFSAILDEKYGPQLDDEAKRLIGIIRNNANRMDQLIDDLLTFAKTSSQHLSKSFVDMSKIVNDIVADVNQQPQRNTVTWKVAALPAATADSATIRQVWINLISNAVKYSRNKPDPVIDIGSRTEKGKIIFFVKDNGAGFDQQYSHKLFKVFQRLHAPRDFEGTGIGLALVEKIISRHGGTVWAEGKKGEEACFYFSLPV